MPLLTLTDPGPPGGQPPQRPVSNEERATHTPLEPRLRHPPKRPQRRRRISPLPRHKRAKRMLNCRDVRVSRLESIRGELARRMGRDEAQSRLKNEQRTRPLESRLRHPARRPQRRRRISPLPRRKRAKRTLKCGDVRVSRLESIKGEMPRLMGLKKYQRTRPLKSRLRHPPRRPPMRRRISPLQWHKRGKRNVKMQGYPGKSIRINKRRTGPPHGPGTAEHNTGRLAQSETLRFGLSQSVCSAPTPY